MKPQPKKELTVFAVSSGAHHIMVRTASQDAAEWLQSEAKTYGNLHFDPGGIWDLYVHAEYDIQEVAAYLESYNAA